MSDILDFYLLHDSDPRHEIGPLGSLDPEHLSSMMSDVICASAQAHRNDIAGRRPDALDSRSR